MVGISEAAAAAKVLGQAHTFLTKLQQANLAEQHRTLVSQALEVVGDATQRLFAMQQEVLELKEENASLRQQLAAKEDWAARRAQYELVQAAGSAFVLRSLAEPKHYACPRCAESKRELHPLQPNATYAGGHACPNCGKDFEIEPSESPDPYAGFRGPWAG